MLWICFNPNRSLDRMWFYIFYAFMHSTVFLFFIGFCSIFLDIARHVCKYNENTLNIKQKCGLNYNDRFGFKCLKT